MSEVSKPSVKPHILNSYFGRHWQGKLSLPVSFWVNGALLNAVLGILQRQNALPDFSGLSPVAFAVTTVAITLMMALVFVWQIIGIWRSANAYSRAQKEANKGAVWASLTHLMMVVWVGMFGLSTMNTTVPILKDAFQGAAGDPDMPDMAFRVLNPQELEIIGGIKKDSPQKLQQVLEANPGIRVVHLNSIGGRVEQAYAMYDILKAKGVDTITSSSCVSACTLVYLAGEKRYLKRLTGALGFHDGTGPFVSVEHQVQQWERKVDLAVAAGVSREYAENIFNSGKKDMVYPERDALLKAKYVTDISQGQFAVSGVGVDVDPQAVAALAFGLELNEAMRAVAPDYYNQLLGSIVQNVMAGNPEHKVYAPVAEAIEDLVISRVPYASGVSVAAFGDVYAQQVAYLNATDANSCVTLMGLPSDQPGTVNSYPEEITITRQTVMADILTSSVGAKPHSVTEEDFAAVQEKVTEQLMKSEQGQEALRTFASLESIKSAPKRCQAFTLFYNAMANLDDADEVTFMRYMLSEEG